MRDLVIYAQGLVGWVQIFLAMLYAAVYTACCWSAPGWCSAARR